jgi:hypothetical protein
MQHPLSYVRSFMMIVIIIEREEIKGIERE